MSSLSPKMMNVLRLGDVAGEYRSRSEVLQAIVTSGVNRAMPEVILFELLLDPVNRGGEKLQNLERAKGRDAAKKYFLRCVKTARAWTASHPPVGSRQDVEKELERLSIAVENFPWRGKGGATDRAVVLAHQAIIYQCGKLDHAAAVRDIAERAGVSISTVSKSHKRLREQGWLRRSSPARGKYATRWRLKLPQEAGPVHTLPMGCRRSVRHEHLAHDVFRYTKGALGKHAGRVYEVLVAHGEASVSDLLTHMPGMRRDGIRRVLRRLRAKGLAERRADLWTPVDVNLDEVAATLGCAGVAERQRAAHAEQRERRERERREWRRRSRGVPRSVRWEVTRENSHDVPKTGCVPG